MVIRKIEKYLLANCSLDNLDDCSKAIETLIKHLPEQLVSELGLRGLQTSINCTTIKHKMLTNNHQITRDTDRRFDPGTWD